MLSRDKCPECGTSFQSDSDENVRKLLADHVKAQHSSIEQRHGKVLGEAQSAFFVIANGGKITQAAARDMHNRIAELLSKPGLTVTPEPSGVSVLEPEQTKAEGEQQA